MRKIKIAETIIKCLCEASTDGISIEDLTIKIYKKNNKKNQLRIIKNVGLLRIRKGYCIKYDKKERYYSLSDSSKKIIDS